MAHETRFHVGTSGFSYDEWKPTFYPKGLKKAEMLSFYGQQFPSVELNNTFYRMPTEKNVAAWSDQVPDSFRFAIKATRGLTWSKKLIDCEEFLESFLSQLKPLQSKLGCVFFQVPKFVVCDVDVLRTFLALQPPGLKTAFEFVSETWHIPAVFEILYAYGATAVISDLDEIRDTKLYDAALYDAALYDAAPWQYLRLRRVSYGDDELIKWRDRIVASGATDAFVFFKHEDTGSGPAMARRFLAL